MNLFQPDDNAVFVKRGRPVGSSKYQSAADQLLREGEVGISDIRSKDELKSIRSGFSSLMKRNHGVRVYTRTFESDGVLSLVVRLNK